MEGEHGELELVALLPSPPHPAHSDALVRRYPGWGRPLGSQPRRGLAVHVRPVLSVSVGCVASSGFPASPALSLTTPFQHDPTLRTTASFLCVNLHHPLGCRPRPSQSCSLAARRRLPSQLTHLYRPSILLCLLQRTRLPLLGCASQLACPRLQTSRPTSQTQTATRRDGQSEGAATQSSASLASASSTSRPRPTRRAPSEVEAPEQRSAQAPSRLPAPAVPS